MCLKDEPRKRRDLYWKKFRRKREGKHFIDWLERNTYEYLGTNTHDHVRRETSGKKKSDWDAQKKLVWLLLSAEEGKMIHYYLIRSHRATTWMELIGLFELYDMSENSLKVTSADGW